jgi:ElaB/YqjD/DUF883 family membrane-anchored ribosome-binding protein
MALDKEKFRKATILVIDKLEGGYWNPKWHGVPKGFENSGETMFGIDRVAGGNLNKGEAGKKFWAKIDAVKTPNVWKHGYLGGNLAPELKNLVVDIMQPAYEGYATRYLKPKTKEIVDNDARLLFHFIYGAWNGPGWFRKFANDMNNAVDSGITNTDKLTEIAIKSRTTEGLKTGSKPVALIAQGGNKIAGFINTLKEKTKENLVKTELKIKKNPYKTIALTAAIALSLFVGYKLIKKNK